MRNCSDFGLLEVKKSFHWFNQHFLKEVLWENVENLAPGPREESQEYHNFRAFYENCGLCVNKVLMTAEV